MIDSYPMMNADIKIQDEYLRSGGRGSVPRILSALLSIRRCEIDRTEHSNDEIRRKSFIENHCGAADGASAAAFGLDGGKWTFTRNMVPELKLPPAGDVP